MKKELDLGTVLVEYDGKPVQDLSAQKEGEGEIQSKDLLLRDAILGYLRRADRMGLNEREQNIAYELGFIVAGQTGKMILTTEQYDAVKKLADNGKVKLPNGQEEYLYPFVVRVQTKRLIDGARNVEEPAQPQGPVAKEAEA